jgi:hypothetical protein
MDKIIELRTSVGEPTLRSRRSVFDFNKKSSAKHLTTPMSLEMLQNSYFTHNQMVLSVKAFHLFTPFAMGLNA